MQRMYGECVLFLSILFFYSANVLHIRRCVHLESVWGDFGGVRAVGNSTVPFLDAFPLTVWLHMDTLMSNMSNDNLANIHVLASVTNLISVQINKYQAMFLSKLLKNFSEVKTISS